MPSSHNAALEGLAALSVAHCLQRLSRVSAGSWQVLDAKVSYGTFEDVLKLHDFSEPAAAVSIGLRDRTPLMGMMVFRPSQLDCVSKCYTGQSFHREARLTPADEIMLVELANLVLNALIGAVLNALKKSSLPGTPDFIQGGPKELASGMLAAAGIKISFRVITVTIGINSGESSARSEVFALIPEEMALELENLNPSAWDSRNPGN